ncbi:MAG: hypothetical protein HKP59_08460 [Lutibacter sp.]|uniref:hypothetical protein n=1 Tax=Lutibacter sp. TaxID=1925666 RepID=UPI00185EFC2F|nr:hypothetical protein [Lutibacter sp.]MBT8317646.1 hypothetical protein [Lutibacter sp.]NNJ58504.1 hypothetical protein [Lutibacter sp.]
MSIKYKRHELYPESILIRKFIGKVTFNEIFDSWKYLCENKLIDHKIKGVINDLLDCEIEMDLKSFENLLNYMKNQDCIRKIKLAVITNNPKIIIFPILGENQKKELKIKPFSTMDAAVDWVQQ